MEVAKKIRKATTASAGGAKSAPSGAERAPEASAVNVQELAKKYKNPLSKKELEEFRQILLEKRRDLIGDLNGIESETLKNRQGGSGELSNMPTHLADLGSDNFEQEFTLGLLESERVMLREINEALERIADGTYGMCLGTGKSIPKPRLRARPWSKYCIEYARMLEKGLVRPAAVRSSSRELEAEAPAETEDDS